MAKQSSIQKNLNRRNMVQRFNEKRQNLKKSCHIVDITINDTKIFEFNLTVKKQLDLFSTGYRCI